jgi:uncharacterized protein YjbI with pentapeptide repeats
VPKRPNSRPIEPSPPDLGDEGARVEALPETLTDLELEERTFSGDAAGRDATGVRLVGCRLGDVDLSGSALGRASLRDVLATGGSWANVDAPEAGFTRVELRSVRATGAAFAGAKLTDVTFADCRLDLSSFRFATLERVRFDRCRMDEADLYGARLSSVVFVACSLVRATLTEARFQRSEMRDCDLEGIVDPTRLRDVGMPWGDILRNAAVFAAGIGIRLLPDD